MFELNSHMSSDFLKNSVNVFSLKPVIFFNPSHSGDRKYFNDWRIRNERLTVVFSPSQTSALLNKLFCIFQGPPSTVQCQAVKMELEYPNSI